MKNFLLGIRSYTTALRFIRDNHLQKWVWGSAVLNLLAFIAVGILALNYAGDLVAFLLESMDIQRADNNWEAFLHFLIKMLVYFIVVLVYLKLYRYIILILFSPILAFLAEKVQEIDQNQSAPFHLGKFISDIFRGIRIALINLVFEVGLTVIFLFFSIILPFLAPVFTIAIFITESYFLGFAMIDYRNEFYGMKAKESTKMIWQNKGLAFGNGITFNLLTLVPLIGVLVAPSWAVIAAGLAVNELDDQM